MLRLVVTTTGVALAACGPTGPSPGEDSSTGAPTDAASGEPTGVGGVGSSSSGAPEGPEAAYYAWYEFEIDTNYLMVSKTVAGGHCLRVELRALAAPTPGLGIEAVGQAERERWSAQQLVAYATHDGCFDWSLEPEASAISATGWIRWDPSDWPCFIEGLIEVELPPSDDWPTTDTFEFSELPVDVYAEDACE